MTVQKVLSQLGTGSSPDRVGAGKCHADQTSLIGKALSINGRCSEEIALRTPVASDSYTKYQSCDRDTPTPAALWLSVT